MQHITKKSLQLRQILGRKINELRQSYYKDSCNKLEKEYEIGKGTLNRIENGKVDAKFITLWKIAEALGLKMSELTKIIEDEVGEDFVLMDE